MRFATVYRALSFYKHLQLLKMALNVLRASCLLVKLSLTGSFNVVHMHFSVHLSVHCTTIKLVMGGLWSGLKDICYNAGIIS